MATLAQSALPEALRHTGAEVLTDRDTLDFYAHDIYARGADLAALVRPANKRELADAVRIATEAGHAVIPRGGGMSYTGGYTADSPGAVLFDLVRMDRVLEVDEASMTVTVEPGCTWATLHEKLAAMSLRTPMWGTLSGLKATIGGGMSQNGIFWGTGRYGTAVESCTALEVVLADGTLMPIGAKHARPFGPDMVGLFLADTGALGIKAEITLKLVQEAKANACCSFIFDSYHDTLATASAIEREGLATECFGFDPTLNAVRMKRESMGADARQLVGMMKKQGSVLKALREGARVALAGRDFMESAKFSLHVLAEGRLQAAADADIARARDIATQHGGSEVENTIPKIVRANPFGPLNSILGPEGQRWAPVHGLLSHDEAPKFYSALEAMFENRRDEMEEHGISCGILLAIVGGAGLVVEPCLYWPDERNPLIEDTVEDAHLARLPILPANEAARALAVELKKAIIDLLHDHGAIHFQIGRTYRYRDSLDPAADALLMAIKAQVDPRGLMNPGSLGL